MRIALRYESTTLVMRVVSSQLHPSLQNSRAFQTLQSRRQHRLPNQLKLRGSSVQSLKRDAAPSVYKRGIGGDGVADCASCYVRVKHHGAYQRTRL